MIQRPRDETRTFLARGIEGGKEEQDNLAGWWGSIIVHIDDDEFLVHWRDEPN
jgi:hypothetical protein